MTTIYGTIPTQSSETNIAYVVSHGKQKLKAGLKTRRPWKEMMSFSMPENFGESLLRIKTNVSYFHINYIIILLFILFISLLWHPVSLIVFAFMMGAWLFLFFLRDEPIIIMGNTIDERFVSAGLSMVTVVVLLLTHASVVILGLVVGLVVVLTHGAFKEMGDLILDEEEGRVVNMKETASSSYSLF